MRYGLPGAAGLLFVVGLASTGLQVPSANAQGVTSAVVAAASTTPAASTATEKKKASSAGRVTSAGHSSSADSGKRYFIEFRSRNAESYGHMYVMYGVTNERHEIIKSEIAGFFPAGDGQHCLNCSVTNWTVGHVLPVPSEIGVSDGDLEEQYVTARFRVWLDAAQYRKVVSYVNERKAHRGPWNALFANCVTFGRDVAQALDLKMPFYMRTPSIVMYPKDVVESLREANGVHADQGPLKDAPGALPAEVAPHPELATQPEDTTAKSAPATSHSKKQLGDQRGEGQMAASAVH